MAMKGSLKEIQLPDLVQLMSVAGKTGRFTLTNEDGTVGHVYLEDGNIVHAEVGNLEGEFAVYTIAPWSNGEFVFEPDVPPPKRTIKKPNASLMMEAARRLDEWKVLQRRIPSLLMVPEFVPLDINDKRKINLSTLEWTVLSKVDGRRNIKQIAQELRLPEFDVAKVLYGLITVGLIRLKEAGKEG